MNKIIMLKGLPASGKSSWATQHVAASLGACKRVNKDDLRAMYDGGAFSKSNEADILRVRDILIVDALRNKKDIVVDDTNFNPAHEVRLRELADQMKAGFEVKEFEASVKECIDRDSKREKSVGAKVIINMSKINKINKIGQVATKPVYEQIIQDPNLPMAIICDIDGTLALKSDRSPFDWKRVKEDKVNTPVEDVLFTYERQAEIILLSGRDEVCRRETEEWLDEHGIGYKSLHMRKEGDNRPDYIVKKELFDANVKGKYRVLFVMDDRNQVVNLWRGMGLTCFQVADGNF